MRTHFFKIIIASTILISSCNNVADNGSDNYIEIPAFLKAYKQTTLPIRMKGCPGDSYSLPLVNPDSLEIDNEDGSIPYCTFKTNGDYYAVIRLGAADCYLPQLMTFEKTGKLIDEQTIAIGYCGSGPGFHCEEFGFIDKDFSIYTSDTISVSEIDSLGGEIKGTTESYVIYKKGRLLSSGKIELSDTLRQTVKK